MELIANLDKACDDTYDRLRAVNDDIAQLQVKREGIYREYELRMQRRHDLEQELYDLRVPWVQIFQ